MRVVFANSPILETVCDFQFEPRQPWDWTVPGLLYERVRTTFPLKQEQRNFEVNVPPIPGNETMPMQQAVTRLQFLREDKRALIQVGPNFLAVNHLRPYPTWEPYETSCASFRLRLLSGKNQRVGVFFRPLQIVLSTFLRVRIAILRQEHS